MKHFIILSLSLISHMAFAADPVVWCSEKDSRNSESRLTLENDKDLVFEQFDENQQLLNRTVVNEARTDIWDGHMTGLITAPGFSMSYENNFGCVKNVNVTVLANRTVDERFGMIMRRLEFGYCKGLSQGFCGK